ncbi:MAG TPA: SpoIIE family protein phosphatase [Verrucomicrobiae bacterium]|jgi:sigma-B regulation protein RsbU (phosphoserine phosphatase)|nr:SpoIIE family protein phosphatase [Verrucomicrobiae bacterium]
MAIQVTDLHLLRDQLLVRRQKLETAVTKSQTANLVQLLEQVDRALERVDVGSYGLCEVCHDTVEAPRLLADPLASVCLGCLNPEEQRALEQDLELAARIQAGLLPARDYSAAGWNVAFHYESAGAVSGDYCDLMAEGKSLYFMIGDVSGKGVAAAMLMANLHAMFRALVPAGLPLEQLVETANRIFCESTLPMQYATLIAGKADDSGVVEICNGGHVPPFHVSPGQVTSIRTSTVPVGLFCDQKFSTTRIHAAPGDHLVLYTDGVSEAEDANGTSYGATALPGLLGQSGGRGPREVVDRCIKDLAAFRTSSPRLDDQTLLVLHFSPFPN